jgi:hypothetical protein
MKKLAIVVLSMLSGLLAVAQNEPHTLFKSPHHVGWYVSPEFGYTQLEGKDVFLSGFSGGAIFNHSFSLGLGGYGIVNSSNLQYSTISPNEILYLYGGYGGLKMEYILKPSSVVHVSFPLLIGGGGLSYSKSSMHDYHYQDDNYATDEFFVIEPGIMMGINLIKFMRLDAGITYRYAPNIDLPETSKGLLNTFNAVVSLKFGKF